MGMSDCVIEASSKFNSVSGMAAAGSGDARDATDQVGSARGAGSEEDSVESTAAEQADTLRCKEALGPERSLHATDSETSTGSVEFLPYRALEGWHATANNSAAAALRHRSQDLSAAFDGLESLKVGEPVWTGSKMSGHHEYEVRTLLKKPTTAFLGTGMSVTRRFADFVVLQAMLQSEFRGAVFPPLPADKSILKSRVDTDMRRAGLELWLHRVCAHPWVSHSKTLCQFLEIKEPSFLDSKVTAKRGSIGTLFSKPPKGSDSMPDDAYIDGIRFRNAALAKNLTVLGAKAAVLVKSKRAESAAFAEWASALRSVAEADNRDSPFDAAARAANETVQRGASVAARLEQVLVKPVRDYERSTLGVTTALQQRAQDRAAVMRARADFHAKEAALAKAEAVVVSSAAEGAGAVGESEASDRNQGSPQPCGSEEKAEAAKTALTKAEASLTEAETQCTKTSERALASYSYHRECRGKELLGILATIAREQAAMHRAEASRWMQTAKGLCNDAAMSSPTVASVNDELLRENGS